jgi:hypothetical protein
VSISVTDLQGNPVSALSLNSEGWPTPNPLTITVTLYCPAGGANCSYPPLSLDIGLYDDARFYVYGTEFNVDGIEVGCSEQFSGVHSFQYYLADCVTLDTGGGVNEP